MKRIFNLWRVIGLMVMLCCLAGAFCACGDAHVHAYIYDDIKPTCEEKGYTLYRCACGYEYKDNYKDPLGHDIRYREAKDPNCVDVGWNEYEYCLRCEYSTRVDRNATGVHTYTEYEYNDDATCVKDGTETAKCENCDARDTRISQDHLKTGVHTYTEYEYNDDATCVKDGTETAKCENCDACDTRTKMGSAIGEHNYVNHRCSVCCSLDPSVRSDSLRYNEIKDKNGNVEGYEVYAVKDMRDTELYIPAEYNGKLVTAIKSGAFSYSKLARVDIPNTVRRVGSRAFGYCDSLTQVNIPNSVVFIDDYAFYKCVALTEIMLPLSVEYLDPYVFEECDSLTIYCERDGAPNGWKSWNSSDCPVVWNCKNNVTDAKGYAYTVVEGIRYSIKNGTATVIRQPGNITGNILIPSSITYGDNKYSVTAIADNAYKARSFTSAELASSIASIGAEAFYDCDDLTSVTIPSGVKYVGEKAFYSGRCLTLYCEAETKPSEWSDDWNSERPIVWNCKNNDVASDGNIYVVANGIMYALKNGKAEVAVQPVNIGGDVVIPRSVRYKGSDYTVTAIAERAFSICNKLTGIDIPDTVTGIGKHAFGGTGLKSVTLPSSMTAIEYGVFESCFYLKSVEIPDAVARIEDYAFMGCPLTSIVIPASLTSIESNSFSRAALESIEVKSGNQKYRSVGNCLIDAETKTLVVGCKNSAIPTDGSVTRIGDYAFRGCSALTNTVIPGAVKSIGAWAFSGCTELTGVEISEGVESMEMYAFSGCGKLTDLTLASSVKALGNGAFNACDKIIQTENGVKYVDRWAVDCDSSVTSVALRADTVGIAENTFAYRDKLVSVTLPNGVAHIGDGAFSHSGLTEIVLPDSVTSIGTYAFIDCEKLKDVTLSGGVEYIGEFAFDRCSRLTSIKFNGTKEKWKIVNAQPGWNGLTSTLVCTDGTVNLFE